MNCVGCSIDRVGIYYSSMKCIPWTSVLTGLVLTGCFSAYAQEDYKLNSWSHEKSLDDYVFRLKSEGSLERFCEKFPDVNECIFGIGSWKSEEIGRVKMESLVCFDQCPLDEFGFYRNNVSGLDIPAVRTKDFDGSAPSRGHMVTMYPIAFKVIRYEGCAGCELTYTYPLRLVANFAGRNYQLPRISRSGFYVPSALRREIALNPDLPFSLSSSTTKVYKGAKSGQKETIFFSKKAMKSYSEMLRLLKFDR